MATNLTKDFSFHPIIDSLKRLGKDYEISDNEGFITIMIHTNDGMFQVSKERDPLTDYYAIGKMLLYEDLQIENVDIARLVAVLEEKYIAIKIGYTNDYGLYMYSSVAVQMLQQYDDFITSSIRLINSVEQEIVEELRK